MEKRIKELVKEIKKHKSLYYKGTPEIDDESFDKLEDELKKIDPNNKILKTIGSKTTRDEKVKHDKKMLSLNKEYNIDSLKDWINEKPVFALFKIDGSACSLIYKNGEFSLAKTRGNGEIGANITSSCKFLQDIPNLISEMSDVEIRGEVFCTIDNFNKLCLEMEKRGLDKPKSPRNVVAGVLGRKDHKDLTSFFSFFAFELLSDKDLNEDLKHDSLLKLGFKTPPSQLIMDNSQVESFLEKTKEYMKNGAYLIDGAVFSINDVKEQKKMGYTSHHPKYKIAFKFQSEGTITKLNDIVWQISRFGVYTPVGIVEPVEVDGATISKVTLHNLKTVELFNLKNGDLIKIVRSGEVIPKFLEVVHSSNNKIDIPSECEYCGHQLSSDDVRLICHNINCSGRHAEYILNFVQKIGIDDLSDKRLEPMIKSKMITSIPDIYKITKKDLLTLPQTKDKLADKILFNINNSKNVDVVKFLASLNFVGGARKSTEELISQGYDSFEKLFNLKIDDLLEIDGFADKKANDYLESLQQNKLIIEELLKLGFNVTFPSKNSELLVGKTFCITGDVTIANNRKELEDLIKSNGGKCSSSVSSKTDFLICNEKSSSSKYKKAEELKIIILTEDEFEKKFFKIK